MIVSPPSSEKRFWPTYFVWRNFSKSSALCTRRRMRTFCGLGEGGLEARRLDPLLKPEAAVLVLDVGVLDADVAAVGLLQRGDDVAQLHLAAAQVGADVERGVEVGFAELELAELELGRWRGGGSLRGSRWAWRWPMAR